MRKLAAIMFTDIAGYTALMSQDEEKALRLLQKNRALLKPIIEQFRGEWLKEIGDGTLSSFASAVDAVNCALVIQRTLEGDPELGLRVGIHIGDVVFERGDVFGDGVNVASRIEPLAEPGCICVSEQVYDSIRNKPGIETTLLGEQQLKGIDHPIRVFTVTEQRGILKEPETVPAKPGKPPWWRWAALGVAVTASLAVVVFLYMRGEPAQAGPINSIAVLPLDNLGGDPDEEYFVEGMHEAIISNLARLSALKVISRTSAMLYKDSDKRMPEIASELGVDAIVEGSVLKAGNRVRITAQLIHGASDEHLWANDYEGSLTDILSLQKTVAQAIAGEIGLALTPEEEAYLASAPQVNPEAYDLYLKGWHFRKLDTDESIPRAVEYLEQAVALDPTFARAWAALAHSYLLMSMWGLWNWDYAYNRTKQALDKALELDPNLPDAHAGLGLSQFLKWDLPAAEASFRRALELDPDNVYALYEYGLFLYRTGRPDEGLAALRRAQKLDPLNHLPLEGIGLVYHCTRQFDKALEYWQAIEELVPGNVEARNWANMVKLEILMQQGRYAEATAGAEKAYAKAAAGWKKTYFWLQLRAEWALGNREKVYAVRDSLRSTGELQQRIQKGNLHWYARLYAIMGEKELAIGLLERDYDDSAIYWRVLLYHPDLDSLRAEPRFKALLQKLGVTEVIDQYGRRIR